MNIILQTISPLHIGSGEKLSPIDYIVRDGYFYRINIDKFLERISSIQNALNEFTNWVEQTSNQLSKERDNRRRSEIRKRFNIYSFCIEKLKNHNLVNEITQDEKYYHYKCKCVSNPEKEINEQLKLPNNEIYIPGTSIKGAIRTALAYYTLKRKPDLWNNIYNGISISKTDVKGVKNVDSRKYVGQEIEKVIFGCGVRVKKKDGEEVIYGDAKYDIMKIVNISDTLISKASLCVDNGAVFTLNKKENIIKRGSPIAMEMIAEKSSFIFKITVDKNFLLHAKRYEDNNKWIGLKDKLKNLFDIDISLIDKGNINSIIKNIEEKILESCKVFGKDIILEEKKWLEKFPNQEISNLITFYNKLDNNSIYLRIGWASGWNATTIGLLFKNNILPQNDGKFLIKKFNLDLTQREIKAIRTNERLKNRIINLDEFPESRRLIIKNKIPYSPLGWVKLSLVK